MRIQHNIMAMNAYRNYNTNTKALSGNLEKLSSGYKINRAGDDAAGLAISEKMRAQITGLDAAQKNVKDGISLVKTAEGAMQEIQDMLNRMDYLATQSANGTYDNEVDRLNLQKEVDALKTEIDRIADSANFNGIKLLDGSLSDGAKAAVAAKEGNFNIAPTGELQDDLGSKTITHTSGIVPGKAVFGVDLGDVEFTNESGEKLTISIGEYSITIAAGSIGDVTAAGTKASAKDIAKAIGSATSSTTNITGDGVTFDTTAGKVTIGGTLFSVTASGNTLLFKQDDNDDTVFEGDLAVKVTGADAAAAGATNGGYKTGKYTAGVTAAAGTGMQDDAKFVVKVDADDSNGGTTPETLTFTATVDNAATTAQVVTALKALTATNAKGDTVTLGDVYDITANADDEIVFAVKAGQTAAGNPSVTGVTYTADTGTPAVGTDDAVGSLAAGGPTTAADPADPDAPASSSVKGTYNTQTTQTVSVNGVEKNLASTVITLDADKMSDGSKIRLGETEYEFSAKEADKNRKTKVYVGDLDLNTESGLKTAIDRLSVVAKDNEVWALGYADKGGKVTLTEKADNTGVGWMDQDDGNKKIFDLTTEDGIKASLGYKSAAKAAVEGDPNKGLTLQIGDTSDSFNQMKVVVGDMHVDAMGTGKYKDENGKEVEVTQTIKDIDISDQKGAADAIQVIRNAINYVSGVRGDLGAIQNRLEHTGNNLSVMAENIQDAESTIRDTDVANEMMGYVKNNILVQSAQAMLAQANQVPQGVLQLLG